MKIIASAALAAALFAAGGASASTVYTVDVWTGAPNGVTSSAIADAAHTPTGAASAEFTYTGDINWFAPGPQNTDSSGNLVGAFIPSANISGFTSPSGAYATLGDFLNASLSVAGDAYASFFKITGSYSGSSVGGTIKHDDGASVYDYLGNAVYSHPGETSQITGNFTLPGGDHPFTVDYVEGNGSPSVLNLAVTAVPEPATWAMMVLGFFGLGAMLRSRGKRDMIAA